MRIHIKIQKKSKNRKRKNRDQKVLNVIVINKKKIKKIF